MKVSELTLEKVFETANLMKQLHIPWAVVDMAKELGVKRTELMRFINEHPKNINTKDYTVGKKGHEIEVLHVCGIYLDARDNPLTEEYAEERRKEVPVWEYDTDSTDFIEYDYEHGAKPILH